MELQLARLQQSRALSRQASSTLLTLVVVPVLHMHVFERSEAKRAMRGSARAQERE